MTGASQMPSGERGKWAIRSSSRLAMTAGISTLPEPNGPIEAWDWGKAQGEEQMEQGENNLIAAWKIYFRVEHDDA